jgi:uncharacterized protein YcfJ
MFKKHLLSIALVLVASTAAADGYAENVGVVVDVQPIYNTIVTPRVQERCFEAQVPVYGYTQPNAGNALAGALIGGAIGNQFGSGSGNDAMTVLGAIVGANQATRNNNVVVGYNTEWRCEMVRFEEQNQIIDYYRVTYQFGGVYNTINTRNAFQPGQRILIND